MRHIIKPAQTSQWNSQWKHASFLLQEIYNHLNDHGELVDDIMKEYKNERVADSGVHKVLASGGLRQKSGAEKVSRKCNQTTSSTQEILQRCWVGDRQDVSDSSGDEPGLLVMPTPCVQ